MMKFYLIHLTGLFSLALYAQASLSEAPAALPVNTIVEQPAGSEPLEKAGPSNELSSAAGETSTTPEVAPESSRPAGIPFEESPYPVILEKMPFGTPPDLSALNAAPPGVDPIKEQRDKDIVAAAFSWTAINITPDGKTAIGFTDLSAKPPASYYMTVGESANSWTVVEADYATETATIEKDGIRISLKFGNKSPIAPTTPGAIPGLAPGVSPLLSSSGHRHSRPSGIPAPTSETSGLPLPKDEGHSSASSTRNALLTSYRERLNERMKQKNDADLKEKEELSKLVSVSVTDALRKQQEEAAAAAAQQQPEGVVAPEGQPIEIPVQ